MKTKEEYLLKVEYICHEH